ncbi:CD209 antigen-like protein 2 [Epinephelus lanceolatus]
MSRRAPEETEEISEETDYINAPACSVDKVAAPPDQRCLFFTQSFPPIAVCWLILLVIMGLRIYFTAVISENNTQLTAENQELKTLMTQNYTVLENKITNLMEELLNLTTQNKELKSQKNILTEQIQEMKANDVSRAQWSIDAYCPKKSDERRCKACQVGWEHKESSCYVIHNGERPEWMTWEEALENCRGKGSDLAVIHDDKEKKVISDYSWDSSGTDGYWIGLRVKDGQWKWIDGSDLTVTDWSSQTQPRPTKGRCAISVKVDGWLSVRCDAKHRWICRQKALSV